MSRPPGLLMKLVIGVLVLAIVAAAGTLAAVLLTLRLPQEALASDLHVFEGRGSNTTVLTTSEGTLVVDTKFWKFAPKLKAAIESLSDKPVRYIVNTHYHWDHVRGDALFTPPSSLVVTADTLQLMKDLDRDFWATPSALAMLPKAGFEEKDHQIMLGGQLIHVVRVGAGHTRGDCVVYFPQQRVVAAGDLFFNGYYPVVDHTAGGSFLEWIDTIDHILALGPERIVPGHGPVTEPAELKAFQGYLRDLVAEVARLKAAGKTREQVVREIRLPVHESRRRNLYNFSSLAMNAGNAYDELEAGGKIPERPVLDVEAEEGEPEGEEGADRSARETPAPGDETGEGTDVQPAGE